MEHKFKVGDKVRVVNNIRGHGFDSGDVVTVVGFFYDGYDCRVEGSQDTWFLVDEEMELVTTQDTPKPFDPVSKPDGGPAEYYDLPTDRPMNTLNDILEWKGDTQWLGDSFHLANVTKAGWRWGIKDGTTKAYDARKFIYSGARLLMKYVGVQELRKTLQNMLDDPQFKDATE